MKLRKQADIANLLSDKIDFKPKLVKRNRKGHFILIKGKIHQKDIIVLHILHQACGHQFRKRKHYKIKNNRLATTQWQWMTSIAQSHQQKGYPDKNSTVKWHYKSNWAGHL